MFWPAVIVFPPAAYRSLIPFLSMIMKRKVRAGLLCLFAFTSLVATDSRAQGSGTYSSLDVTFDPRSVSLGEATVALAGSYDAFGSNPAGLSNVQGAWLSYDYRGMEWTRSLGLDDMRYRSWELGARTPLGTIAVAYRRQDLGEFAVSTMESPEGVGTLKAYNHEFGLAWAYDLLPTLSVGAVAKTYTDVQTTTDATGGSSSGFETQRPYLLDLGMQYHCGALFGKGRVTDAASLGISLQNFGTDYRIKMTSALPEGFSFDEFAPLPRTLRLGVAYHLSLRNPSSDSGSVLQLNLLGEYRNVLNSYPTEHDYHWGWGLELTAYELFTVRLGGYFQPYQSVYGGDRVVAIRFGAGLHLPARLLAEDLPPVVLNIDYAAIPLYRVDPDIFPNSAGTANVFSLRVEYETNLFGGAQ